VLERDGEKLKQHLERASQEILATLTELNG
jgi:hypothetical protein